MASSADHYEDDVHGRRTVFNAPFSLNERNISEFFSYVLRVGREADMANNLAPELGRRKRLLWPRNRKGAAKNEEDAQSDTSRDLRRRGLRRSRLRHRSRIEDAVARAGFTKISRAGHVMPFADTCSPTVN